MKTSSSYSVVSNETADRQPEKLVWEPVKEIRYSPGQPDKYMLIEGNTLILLTRLVENCKGILYLERQSSTYTITINGDRDQQTLPSGLIKLEYYYINGKLKISCLNPANYD